MAYQNQPSSPRSINDPDADAVFTSYLKSRFVHADTLPGMPFNVGTPSMDVETNTQPVNSTTNTQQASMIPIPYTVVYAAHEEYTFNNYDQVTDHNMPHPDDVDRYTTGSQW